MANGGELDRAEALFARLDAAGKRPAPDHIGARANHAEALRRLGRLAEAEAHLRKTLAWAPDFGGAHYNLGVVLLGGGRAAEAAASFREAERLTPGLFVAAVNLAAALRETGEAAAAAEAATRALKNGAAAMPAAWANLAAALLEMENPAAAAEAARRALALAPGLGEGWGNLAAAVKDMDCDGAALAALNRALVCGLADPGGALAQRAQLLRRLCRWEDLPAASAALRKLVMAGGSPRLQPWIFLSEGAGRAAELAVARRYAEARAAAARRGGALPALTPAPTPAEVKNEGGPLRVGLLSSDFHDHATALLLAEALERCDRGRTAYFAYSYGRDDGGPMRRRLETACARFVDIRDLGHQAAAARVRADGVQVLVDLKGYTQGARLQIAALRPAPVQAQWLGYPGTMGADFIDYILADAVVAPFAHQNDYAEKIVHLPGCYQPNDSRRVIADTPCRRADVDLPEGAFVFCGFNAAYKLNPASFDVWCGLLRAVPGSVLWLLDPGEEAAANLRRAAAARGVAADRLVFAPRRGQADYLAQFRLADLFLDAWPVGGHTTASDALWAGLPTLTWEGPAFAGRVCASLVRALGLPELAAESPADYARRALTLADDPVALAALRARLATARDASGVFDGARFARGLAAACAEMWRRWREGLPPAPFAVSDVD